MHSFHLRFTVVLSHAFLHDLLHCSPRQGACCWSNVFYVAYVSYPGIGMPVVPCGRRVVISGMLAGGTPNFRNALMAFLHPSRAPCNCDVFRSVFVSMHARLNLQHISCCNSHRADLSIATMRFFLGFCLVFLFCFCFCCVLCFCGFCLLVLCVFLCVVAIAHGQYLDCVWVLALF